MTNAAVWESAQNALIAGDESALDALLREHEQLFRQRRPPAFGPEPGRLAPDYSAGDARAIIVRNHHFETWATFAEHIEALKRRDSQVALFEAAVDAVIDGDVATLEQSLRDHPDVIRARSTRTHHATLLHYVGANGVEDFRQKTPENAVAVARVLLEAGADVDAAGKMYGGTTTLGLVATSIHPLLAGVQDALMEILLDYGATLDGAVAGDDTRGSVVNACLANGRPQAAEFLARRGARLDLEGAAGVGRLDVVNSFFDEDGRLNANATTAHMKDGFTWACEYGRTDVVDFLLQRGTEVSARLKHHGQTGLHWAAYGGHLDTVKLLLARHAPVNVKDESFGGTPLGWALYGWGERAAEARRSHDYEVVALLVAAGATVEPEWLAESDRGFPLNEKVRADARMLEALTRKTSNA